MAIGAIVEVLIHSTLVLVLLTFKQAVNGAVAQSAIDNGITALDTLGIVPASIGLFLLIYDILSEHGGSSGNVE
jgi:hypothetical protein